MWNILELRSFMLNTSEIAEKYNLGVAIGGSVGIYGVSANDLDLFFFNLKNSVKTEHQYFIREFSKFFKIKILGFVNHSEAGDNKLVYIGLTENKKKIDLFFPSLNFKDGDKKYKILKRKTPKLYGLPIEDGDRYSTVRQNKSG